jgi:hypothetical protein
LKSSCGSVWHPLIWVGDESIAALKRVLELGDGWHMGLVSLEAIKRKFVELRALMAAVGRDFSRLEIASMVDNRARSGADIRAYGDIGVTGLYVATLVPGPKSVLSPMRECAQ